MSTINFQDIQRDPLTFLKRLEAGESLVVLRGDEQVAEVTPVKKAPQESRPYGLSAGAFTVPADFDDPLPNDVLSDFEQQ